MTPATYGALRAARDGDVMADRERYQSGNGNLLHMAQCLRPDIAAPVGALGAYSSAPTSTHYDALLDVIRYVASTADRGITYGQSETPIEIWCGANFAACPDTRRSVTGWLVVCFGGAVAWESCKQPTTAASTMHVQSARSPLCCSQSDADRIADGSRSPYYLHVVCMVYNLYILGLSHPCT
jgi:hypothetical protein